MTKYIFFAGISTLLSCCSTLKAQNLIPNPSFEEYTQCPGEPPNYWDFDIWLAPPWTTPTQSSDYFHTCGYLFSGVPSNRVGFENARTGEAYAGFMLLRPGGPLTDSGGYPREYIEVPLLEPLKKDSVYLLKIYVSLADSSKMTTDNFEVLFTSNLVQIPPHPVFYLDSYAFLASPQLTNPPGNYLDQQEGWQELKWIYRARGNERFMTLGIFSTYEEGIHWHHLDGELGNTVYIYVDDVSLEQIPTYAAELALEGDLIACDSTGAYTLTASTPYHTDFRWSTGDTTRTITVQHPGVYTVTATYNGDCPVMVTDSIEVVYRPLPPLELGADTAVCIQDFPLSLTTSPDMDAWLWSTGDTTASISIAAPGTYWVQTQHPCGVQTDTILIAENLVPPLELGPDTVICGEALIQIPLAASQGFATYSWNTGETDAAILADAPGTYGVQVTHACGVFTDNVVITRQPLLSLSLPADTIACLENGFVLNLPPGFDTYAWNTGQTSASILITQPGVFSATAAYVCGVVSDTIRIEQAPELIVTLPEDMEIRLGESIVLNPLVSNGAVTLAQWEPPAGLECPQCLSTAAQPPGTTRYTLFAADVYGCTATATILITVSDQQRVFIPNAFSPNGDGINDRLIVFAGPEVAQVNAFRIFDRWGGLVFERFSFLPNGEAEGWDGRADGKMLQPGVYVWLAEIKLLNGESRWLKGEVSLVR